MQKNHFTIRQMSRQEVDIAIDWAAMEGWNPGLHDADSFYAADPTGFLIGLLGDKPVATLSAVKYGDSFGFLGFYIVKPGYRSKGYGIQMWDSALAGLPGRTIGLDSVVAEQDNYKKYGFTVAYGNMRYQGRGGGHFPAEAGIVPLSDLPFEDVCNYDRPFFFDDRRLFLRRWIAQPQGTALGILQKGKLTGYGVLRICRSGYKIGPLFADTPEVAEQLLMALKANVPESAPVFLDPPAVNPAAVALAERHHMVVVFETVRMYREKIPGLPLERVFGVTTFELG